MAYSFDGTGDYIQVASNAAWNPTNVTVIIRLYVPTGAALNAFDRVIECGGFNQTSGYSIEFSNPATSVFLNIWNAGSFFAVGSAFTFSNDTWHTIGFSSQTSPSQSHKFWADGAQQGATSASTRGVAAKSFTIAAHNNNPATNDPQIRVAQLLIIPRACSDAEMADLTNTRTQLRYRGGDLTCFWPLNPTYAANAIDGNTQVNGTVTNASSLSDSFTWDFGIDTVEAIISPWNDRIATVAAITDQPLVWPAGVEAFSDHPLVWPSTVESIVHPARFSRPDPGPIDDPGPVIWPPGWTKKPPRPIGPPGRIRFAPRATINEELIWEMMLMDDILMPGGYGASSTTGGGGGLGAARARIINGGVVGHCW